MPKTKKEEEKVVVPAEKAEESEAVKALKEEIEELRKKNTERDEKLKMLYEIADKGRVFQYESNKTEKKPLRVKLSVFGDGIIVGWRTLKDELVKHPTTGMTVGENQEYEVLILNGDGSQRKSVIAGYPAFSNARYDTRIEAEVIGKSEGFDGDITYDVKLLDGRVIKLNQRFVN